MKTETIIWSKNFEIYKYHYETYGETGIIEEGETKTQARQRLKVCVYEALHEDHPHLVEVYPMPKEAKKEEPIVAYYNERKSVFDKMFKHPADKVINIQRGAALLKCINDCTSLSQLEQYESQLDSDAAEKAYDEKMQQFQHKKVS